MAAKPGDQVYGCQKVFPLCMLLSRVLVYNGRRTKKMRTRQITIRTHVESYLVAMKTCLFFRAWLLKFLETF